MRLDRDSQQYVKVGVSKNRADPGPSLTVAIAIVPKGTRPAEDDFISGTWATTTFTSGGAVHRHAMILVAGSEDAATGAQDLTLTPTSYPAWFHVFVKVTDVPEVPVERVGALAVI